MSQKSIFITGGASGIGRAVAQHFAAKGWFVGLADINDAGMKETAALLPKDQCSIHKLDVRDSKQWKKALADFNKKTGRLDVMFNNAGLGRGGPLQDVPFEDHELTIDVNLTGVVRGAYAAFEYLAKTPGSCLLNTSSAAGIYGPAGIAVYGATKFGVRGLTEALDIEWADHGIKVRSLMPSFIDTPILDRVGVGSNMTGRESVAGAGLEISPVSMVADAAWNAVHGETLHTKVGKTANRIAFLARFMPNRARKMFKKARLAGGPRISI